MKILLLRPGMGIIPNMIPPLGLLSLAGYLRQYEGGHEVKVVDCRPVPDPMGLAEKELAAFKPDMVGITGFSLERKVIHECAALAKKLNPSAPVVVGGPYATASNQTLLSDANINFVVIGEGETVFADFVKRYQTAGLKDEYGDLKSFAYRTPDGALRHNPERDFIPNLDTIPMVAWDLIDVEYYFAKKTRASMNLHRRSSRLLPIVSSRGCPYHCTYCHDVFGKKLRKRSADHVLSEIKHLYKTYGVKEIEILDDIFNADKERAKAIFDGVIKDGMKLGFSFPNGLRADLMDEELVDKMKQAGVYRLIYAVESGSPRIQKLMKKNLNLEKARHIIDYTARKNISVGGFYMMGFLDENEEDVRMTIDFACKSRMHTAAFFILQPFPNTEIFNQALERGIILPTSDEETGTHYNRVTRNISNVPTERLEQLKEYAQRRFWFNPMRIIRFLRATPIRENFFHKVWTALRILLVPGTEKEKPLW